MVILPLLSVLVSGWPFGFASAPYDPAWALRHPRGPPGWRSPDPPRTWCSSIVAVLLIRIGVLAGVFESPLASASAAWWSAPNRPTRGEASRSVVSALFSMNLALMALNLIPLPPLDGSAGVAVLLSESIARRVRRVAARTTACWERWGCWSPGARSTSSSIRSSWQRST